VKFSGKGGNGPVNKWLNFGGDPDHGSRYIATFVRRALAEVCSVPVLPVTYSFGYCECDSQYWCSVT